LVKIASAAYRFLARRLPKAGLRLGVSVLAVIGSVEITQTAVANGDTRTLSFYHTHSHEKLSITFKKNGRYDPAALKQLNYFLRDWRNQKQTNMDPRLFDVIWEVYKDAGASEVIQIVSSYRSPETNAGLRSRTKGVAEHSQHMLGKAMDIHIDGIPMSKVREAGLRLQRGGVGFYPTSGLPFVHLDVGNVRHWPRMTRDQLVRVFPDGRTVHVPTDGKPLKGYALALADIKRNGATVKGQPAINSPVMMASAGKSGGNFLTRFLGGDDDEETTAPAAPVAVAAARVPAPSQTTPAQAVAKRAPEAPVPAAAPSAPVAIAQIVPVPVPVARPSLGYAAEPELAAAPQMAWARGAEATPALRGSDEAAARSKAQLEMAALVAAAQTTTPAAVVAPAPVSTAAVAMPMPRPQTATTPAALVAQADVPLPVIRPTISAPVTTASLGLSGADAARLLASAVRRMASGEVAAPVAPAATAKAKAEALAPTAVTKERSARDADVVLAAPQLADATLLTPPAAIVPATFGGNPTAGLRSDTFAGASVAMLRTESFGAPRGARIVDVAPRG
jgi:uncharacterized protein YcbK (DUF882 family)